MTEDGCNFDIKILAQFSRVNRKFRGRERISVFDIIRGYLQRSLYLFELEHLK